MIFALSEGMPWTSLIFWRTLCPAAGSIFSNSRFFQRDAALDQLLREDLDDSLELVVVGRGELDGLVALEVDLGLRVLEVEARANLFHCLVNCVLYFLKLYLADYVEAAIGCHVCFPLYLSKSIIAALGSLLR